jgi:hypothetical protein
VPRQGLLHGPLGEDTVAKPGYGIAASLDDVAEQRVIGAVGDAEDSFEVRQSDKLGGAGGTVTVMAILLYCMSASFYLNSYQIFLLHSTCK